ncbi:MAG TPA: MFS transporter [Candidatus Dormibacteraeota bacterium]|nr:MFS transporter [Candidatus Dormibacteraeota bacterium]
MPFGTIVAARAVRTLSYGALSVFLAVLLADKGLAPAQVGMLFTIALVSGALSAVLLSRVADRLGRRTVLIGGGLVTALAAILLARAQGMPLLILAVALGTISPSAAEVGPFGALEQAMLAQIVAPERRTRAFATYNLVGTFAIAVGALAAAVVSRAALLWAYLAVGLLLAGLYATLGPSVELPPDARTAARPREGTSAEPVAPRPRFGVVERLTALFGLDALAGGFVVQGFIAYWFHLRFGVDQRALGTLLFGANLLAAFSFPLAARLAERFGLLNTMVFTHLPSNVLLALVPLMPTYPLAAVVLWARFALSQMDVPTRQAYTMAIVPPEERARAAGLTNAVRPGAQAISPILAGIAVQHAALGLPFVVSGVVKIVYDLALYRIFKPVKLKS